MKPSIGSASVSRLNHASPQASGLLGNHVDVKRFISWKQLWMWRISQILTGWGPGQDRQPARCLF